MITGEMLDRERARNERNILIGFFVAIVVLGLIIAFILGAGHEANNWTKRLVEENHAEWIVVDSKGRVEFRLKEWPND